jgi:hypothetical protein
MPSGCPEWCDPPIRVGLGDRLLPNWTIPNLTERPTRPDRRHGSRPVDDLPAVISVGEAVTSLARLLGDSLGPELRLEVDLRASDDLVRIDPIRFEQVLLNLILNARDAVGPRGTVTVATEATSCDHDAPGVFMTVTDTGQGMDADTLARSFDPFFTTKGATTGSGLGLPTVKRIVESASGPVSARSTPGEGTSIAVWWLAAHHESQFRPVSKSRSCGPTVTEVARPATTGLAAHFAPLAGASRGTRSPSDGHRESSTNVEQVDHGDAQNSPSTVSVPSRSCRPTGWACLSVVGAVIDDSFRLRRPCTGLRRDVKAGWRHLRGSQSFTMPSRATPVSPLPRRTTQATLARHRRHRTVQRRYPMAS